MNKIIIGTTKNANVYVYSNGVLKEKLGINRTVDVYVIQCHYVFNLTISILNHGNYLFKIILYILLYFIS